LRGYTRALASARIPYDPQLVIAAHLSVQHSRDRMMEWLHQHAGEPLPHAVFCVNDGAAVGCLEALAKAGLRVPDDISVAGFDDSLAARMTIPQLSTVRQPLRAMGQRAVELLLSRVSHHGSAAGKNEKPVVFPVDLVTRASISAPPIVARLVPDCR
jgi:LacI family transcriptional regulator